jgi:hypothetical protein
VLQEQMTALDDFTRPSAMFRFVRYWMRLHPLLQRHSQGPTLYIYLKRTDVTTGETLDPQSVTAADDPAAVKAGISAAVAIIADHFETRGQVLRTDAASFTTDLGHRNNVRPGDVLAVYRQGEVMVDPLTYQVVGFDRRKVGQARVTEVLDAELARAELIAAATCSPATWWCRSAHSAVAPTRPRGLPCAIAAERLAYTAHHRAVEASVFLNNNFVGHQREAPMTLLVRRGGTCCASRRAATCRCGAWCRRNRRRRADHRALTPQEGYLYLTSTPPTCEVYLDGQYEGLTPCGWRGGRRVAAGCCCTGGYRDYGKKVPSPWGRWTISTSPCGAARRRADVRAAGDGVCARRQFTMGCDAGPEDERPAHVVTLDGFFVDRHEVMVKEYRQFCELTGRTMPQLPVWVEDNHPMTNVSWADATAYAAWSGKRLPTEAEWEYLARNLGRLTQPPQKQAANIQGVNGADRWPRTAPVGCLPRIAWGSATWRHVLIVQRMFDGDLTVQPGSQSRRERTIAAAGDSRGVLGLWPEALALPRFAVRHPRLIGFRCVTDARCTMWEPVQKNLASTRMLHTFW